MKKFVEINKWVVVDFRAMDIISKSSIAQEWAKTVTLGKINIDETLEFLKMKIICWALPNEIKSRDRRNAKF